MTAYRLVVGLLLLQLLHHDAPFFVLATLILKPDSDHSGAEPGHFHQLLLHEGVGPGIGGIAGPQSVELLFVEDGPDAGSLFRLLMDVRPESRLPGGDRFCCKGGREGEAPGQWLGKTRRQMHKEQPCSFGDIFCPVQRNDWILP